MKNGPFYSLSARRAHGWSAHEHDHVNPFLHAACESAGALAKPRVPLHGFGAKGVVDTNKEKPTHPHWRAAACLGREPRFVRFALQ